MVTATQVELVEDTSPPYPIKDIFDAENGVFKRSLYVAVITAWTEVYLVTRLVLLVHHHCGGLVHAQGRALYEAKGCKFLTLCPYEIPLHLPQLMRRPENRAL